MKSLQRLCAAVALAFVLTLPAFAGVMDTGPGVSSPPPPPASALTRGDMDTPRGHMETGSGAMATAGDSFTGAVLRLLEDVLTLF